MLKRSFLIIISLFFCLPGFTKKENLLTNSLETGPIVVDFNFDWKFNPGDSIIFAETEYDDDTWRKVNLPHDFQINQPWIKPNDEEKPDLSNQMANVVSRLSSRGFKESGIGWYRKTFLPDSNWKGKRVLLDFEGIMLNGDVFFNGEKIGGTDYGYLGFETDISEKINFDGENVVAVRCDTGSPENSRWYTGGGLYRDVKLKIGNPNQYFTRNSLKITTPDIKDDSATIVVEGEIANFLNTDSLTVEIEIIDKDGKEKYSGKKRLWTNPRQKIREFCLDTIILSHINLWDIDSPYLYTLKASIYDPEGKIFDISSKRFGIRSIEYSPEFGFKLNRRKVILKGIANHHTLGALGAAVYPRAIEKRIKLLKDFGFNHIRTSHNPYSESFLDLCDENGILVVDELYDKWTSQYSGGRKKWTDLWQHDIPEWIKRDRNHPSVVMWSLGNELQLIPDLPYNDWGVTPYKLQKTLLNRYDNTRPVTVAMHPRGRNELTDSLPAPLVLETDIAAYNYRYMYFPGDGEKFPWMIFYQSEANASGMGSNYFNMNLDKVVGLAYWGMIDYLGESKGWPAKGWTEGIFDISLQPKPLAYFLKSYFKPEEPLVHIGIIESKEERIWNEVPVGTMQLSENWNREEGSTVNLYTFTNGCEVELFLNGESLGKAKNNVSDNSRRNKILWENVTYEAGYLEAVVYDEFGKALASHKIKTAGLPVRLTASFDNPSWKADGYDLQHIWIYAEDENGIVNPLTEDNLKFEVKGPAEIVGIINGDLNSNELFYGDSHSLFNGNLTLILRSQKEAGNVNVIITSDSLPLTKLDLHTSQP